MSIRFQIIKQLHKFVNKKQLNENQVRFKHEINLPDDILKIKDIFVKNGYELFLVGGSVRDILLNKVPKDYDLATDATPNEVERILEKNNYKTIPTGKAFGVINVITDNDEYEISTFRSEVYSEKDKRRPESVEFSNIYQDVLRRDITINALFYDIENKEIVDLVGGIDDLKNGIIRTVGDPKDRFNEDRLRILRLLRFSARLNSKIDKNADEALKKDSSLEGISAERIRDEFIKGIKSAKSVSFFLNLINDYNLFKWVFPNLNINKSFNNLSDDYITTIASILIYNDPKIIGKRLNELRYTIDEIKNIQFLLSFLNLDVNTSVALKKMQKNTTLTDEQIIKFAKINNIDEKLVNTFIDFELTVNSEEVMDKFNLKPSKELGEKITALEIDNFKKMLK
jgi:tRNA nucleotidyltransferase (CCA-adding enzyme)